MKGIILAGGLVGMRIQPHFIKRIAGCYAAILLTALRAFDYCKVGYRARLIVDTRDAMRPFERELGDRLVRA